MKRLILMRHAKSDWSGEALIDHDRALNDRGRANARALGDWLRDQGIVPDEVLCSSAMRTQETLAGLNLPGGIKTTITRKLYLASLDQILSLLQRATGNSVLVLGHNPGSACVPMKSLPPRRIILSSSAFQPVRRWSRISIRRCGRKWAGARAIPPPLSCHATLRTKAPRLKLESPIPCRASRSRDIGDTECLRLKAGCCKGAC